MVVLTVIYMVMNYKMVAHLKIHKNFWQDITLLEDESCNLWWTNIKDFYNFSPYFQHINSLNLQQKIDSIDLKENELNKLWMDYNYEIRKYYQDSHKKIKN